MKEITKDQRLDALPVGSLFLIPHWGKVGIGPHKIGWPGFLCAYLIQYIGNGRVFWYPMSELIQWDGILAEIAYPSHTGKTWLLNEKESAAARDQYMQNERVAMQRILKFLEQEMK